MAVAINVKHSQIELINNYSTSSATVFYSEIRDINLTARKYTQIKDLGDNSQIPPQN
jgi:hypothetical protein